MIDSVITKNVSKFKSVLVSVSYMMPLKAEYASKNALLANILDKKTKNYLSEKEIKIELAKAYAANINISVTKTESAFILRFDLEAIKEKEAIVKALDVLYEIMFNPFITENKGFDEDIFNNEKKNLLQKIKEERDDKKAYALKRLEKIMFADDAYSESLHGREEYICSETATSLYSYYLQIKKESSVMLTIAGNLSEFSNIAEKVKSDLEAKLNRKLVNLSIESRQQRAPTCEIKFEEEKQQVLQSVLTIGAKVYNTSKDDTYKIMVYNQILGGNPASKLFQNVREKESLAYFAKSKYDRQQEAIYMICGILPENFEKARDIVIKQVEDIRRRLVSSDELNAAKNIILGAFADEKDKKESILVRSLSNNLYFGRNVEIDEMINGIQKVTLEDVFEIAQKVEIEAIFLVGGVSDGTK